MTENAASQTGDDGPAYVDTPYGMVTASGQWYHIPEADVREYAGEVLEHVSLDQLLRWADVWGRSPRTLTAWLLPLLLWGLPVGWAVASALGVFVGWALVSPGLPTLLGARVGTVLDYGIIQALYYVFTLSVFAAQDHLWAVGVGLAGFVLLRWGVLQWALRPVLRPVWRRLYPLPITDQVLRGLIVRVALKHRLALPQVDAITKDIMDNWGSHSDGDNGNRPDA
ncbi:MAG: hypothetical protein ACLFTE_03130 [Salinivenus sp.]